MLLLTTGSAEDLMDADGTGTPTPLIGGPFLMLLVNPPAALWFGFPPAWILKSGKKASFPP